MKDNEIIRALEICISGDCDLCSCKCESVGDCRDALNKKSLDLINRHKAEIESKNDLIHRQSDVISEQKEKLENIYSEAVKEFAERLNKEAEKVYIDQEGDFVEADNEIYDTVADWCKEISYNLVKEMVGADNG